MSFLEYLYTDHAPIEEGDSIGILELANRWRKLLSLGVAINCFGNYIEDVLLYIGTVHLIPQILKLEQRPWELASLHAYDVYHMPYWLLPSPSQQVRDESAHVTLWTVYLQACGEGH